MVFQLKELFEGFKGLRIAVVGDAILDKYVFGKVERISPEAPVPVFEIEREEFRAGGAANVALNLKALGVGSVALFSRIGKDPEGAILKNLLKEKNIESRFAESKDVPTIRKTRLIAKAQQLIRIDREKRDPLREEEVNFLFEELKNFRPHAVVVSDYAKGVFVKPLAEGIKSLSIPTFVDPRPRNINLYKGFTCITPNLKEFEEIRSLLKVEGDFETSAREVRELLDLERLVITLSERGIALVGKEVAYFPATAREVFDVTGAGDTVVATLSAVITLTGDWRLACRLSNIAAGIVVGKLGTAVATPEEIEKEFKRLTSPQEPPQIG